MKRLFGFLVGLGLVLTGVYVIVPPVILRSQPVEQIFRQRVEEFSQGHLTYGDLKLSYFPFIDYNLSDVSIQSESLEYQLDSPQLKVRIARWALLLGKNPVSRILAEDARWTGRFPGLNKVEIWKLEKMKLEIGPLRAGQQIGLNVEGSFAEDKGDVKLHGELRIADFQEWDWSRVSFGLVMEGSHLDRSILKPFFLQWLNVRVDNGDGKVYINGTKNEGESWVDIDAESQVREFSYRVQSASGELTSPEFPVNLSLQAAWNPETAILNLRDAVLELPVGMASASGTILLGTREVEDVRIKASDIVLENIPQYFVLLKDVIPFNIGFSGLSQLEMTLTGTFDHLAIHANWDFTQALLTYARYFSKPKDFPLIVNLDSLLKNGQIFTGDFSFRFESVTMKGTVTDLDFRTGEGQINVISNKFQLNGWEKLIPPFKDYQADGKMKFLANLKGNLQKLYDTKAMFNISLEEAKLTGPEGYTVDDMTLAFDISPLSLEVRKSLFHIGDAAVETNLMIYNWASENPLVELHFKAGQLDAVKLYRTFQDLAGGWLNKKDRKNFEKIGEWLAWFIPEGEKVDDFRLTLKREDGIWLLEDLTVDVYDGSMSLLGEWNTVPGSEGVSGDAKIQRLNLARFGGRGGVDRRLLNGNLFLTFQGKTDGTVMTSEWRKSFEGSGNLLITNGEFYRFDLLGAVGGLPELTHLEERATGTTLFYDLKTGFDIGSERIAMDEINLIAEDYTAQATGELTLDGLLNYRVNVYIDPLLVSQNLETHAATGEKQFIGPFPFLLSGAWDRMDLQPDPSVVPGLLQELTRKRRFRALSNFQTEDAFFAQAETA